MCLLVNLKEYPGLDPLIAQTEIYCWKVIRWVHPEFTERRLGGISVPCAIYFRSYIYGRSNTAEHFAKPEGIKLWSSGTKMDVTAGLHTYVDFTDAVHEFDYCNYSNSAKDHVTYEIMHCIIPKGAKYFLGYVAGGIQQSYAAETLIINDIDDNNFPQGHFLTAEEQKNFFHVPNTI